MGVVVPWLLTHWRTSNPPSATVIIGGALIASGSGLLLETIIRLVREGRGTPHPVAPTEELVMAGPTAMCATRCTSRQSWPSSARPSYAGRG